MMPRPGKTTVTGMVPFGIPGMDANDNKPKGKMTAYAFFVQICRDEHKRKHPDEQVSLIEFTKKCSERWKTMTEKEKRRFNQMADADKKRYDVEMVCYGNGPPSAPVVKGAKRTKKKKDPNAPKRSMSAFFWYSQDERAKVRGANPEYNVGDVAKELGRRWADVGAELKSKYEALAEKDRARYGNAKREYQISLKNGTKPIIKNGDHRDSGDEGSPPNKLPNLNSYRSQGDAQTMQERVPAESAEHSSENHEADDNSSPKNTNNNDSPPNTTNDDTTVGHGPPNANETKSNGETNQELNNKNENGDAPDEEEEDLDEESE